MQLVVPPLFGFYPLGLELVKCVKTIFGTFLFENYC